ncbi:chromosome partitioning protein ParA [Mycobacteroides chelonae]|nr:chromosome partitioning protein ParA [Mycobacteroides chelonae]
MLDEQQIKKLVSDMWTLQLQELGWLDRIYGYVKGLRGRPTVPEGAGDELEELAKLSVMNVLGVVRDSYAQNLSVVGYREATAEENDPAWKMWQRNRMDARQAEVYGPALTYGSGYITVLPGDAGPVFHPRSPRQLLAVYDDPTLDACPQYALETWVTQRDAKPHRRGLLIDDTHTYQLDLGELAAGQLTPDLALLPLSIREVEDPVEHGATLEGRPVCPVVRFVNNRDADDWIVGEVAPLIQMQQTINNVNFDRLIVSRFGAFPQKVITGWAGTKEEVLKASGMRVWAFEDEGVDAKSFPAASMDGYNSLLASMIEHVAMTAGISPSQVTGKMINVSADALAAAEATMQRKLSAKRDSFGESWEQVFRIAASMDGDAQTADDSAAEVVWRDTEARSFATVVDGIVKLASTGIPIELMLTSVPGFTQQQIQAISKAMQEGRQNEQYPVPPPTQELPSQQ